MSPRRDGDVVGSVDLGALQEEAKSSQDRESFRALWRSDSCRIGVGARLDPTGKASYFMEVVVNLCSENGPIALDDLERSTLLLKRLKDSGYSLSCDQYGSVSCEKTIQPRQLENERKAIIETLREHAQFDKVK